LFLFASSLHRQTSGSRALLTTSSSSGLRRFLSLIAVCASLDANTTLILSTRSAQCDTRSLHRTISCCPALKTFIHSLNQSINQSIA
jgi:hypothetical protein